MEEGRPNLNLSCSFCFEEFKVPKMLSCGHTFCCPCVSQTADSNSSLKCPTCRKDILLPVSGRVEDFPTNYALMNFIPDHEAMNAEDDAVCECKKHKTPMEFYCKSCEKQICAKCLLNDHKPDEHNIVTASDMLTDLSGELQKLEEKLQDCKEEEKSLGENILQGIDHYEQDKEKLEQDIKLTLETQQERLKKTAETLQNVLQREVEGRAGTFTNLKMQYSNLQALSNQIQENCKDLNNCFGQLSLSHSCSEIQKLSKNIETLKGDLESVKTVCKSTPITVGLEFTAASNFQVGSLNPVSFKPMILQHPGELYIQNLDDDIDDDRLHEEFARFGNILSAKVMRNEEGIPHGYGFVCFSTLGEATEAITQMSNRIISVKPLYVSLVPPSENGPSAQQAVYAPGLTPLTVDMMAQATLHEQKYMIGQRLHSIIRQSHRRKAGQISGMLLEQFDTYDLFLMLQSPESLKARVDEALTVLAAHRQKDIERGAIGTAQ